MHIFKIVALGIAATILAVFLKNWRAEIAIQISLLTVALIFFAALPYLKTVLVMFEDISERCGIESQYISIILKTLGIACVTQIGAELCRDAGECAVASKIEFGGKVMIVTLSMPILYSFLEIVERIVRF